MECHNAEYFYGECATCRRTNCHQAHFLKLFHLYVSFLSHSSIKIVSQKKVILPSLSQKLVSGFFQQPVLWRTPMSVFLQSSHTCTLSLCLSRCLPVSPSFHLHIKITVLGLFPERAFHRKGCSPKGLFTECLTRSPFTECVFGETP